VLADAFFSIGASHLVCQDYATTGRDAAGAAFVLVSDGCSSAGDSDIGARLLCTLAARALRRSEGLELPAVLDQVLGEAHRTCESLGVPSAALDATLLAAHQRGNGVSVWLAGDGVVAGLDRDGAVTSWSLAYDGEAPAYPSYLLDPERLGHYLEDHGRRRLTIVRPNAAAEVHFGSVRRDPYLLHLELDSRRFPLLMVLSDGSRSFVRDDGAGTRGRVALGQVMERLMRIRRFEGRYAARRARRFLTRECHKRQWRPEDDLALGALASEAAASGALAHSAATQLEIRT
jgi:hypothetical protein